VCRCPVCGAGARDFLSLLRAAAEEGGSEDAVAARVHRLLPLPLPKKARREERLVVAALRASGGEDGSERGGSGGGAKWLLVRLPGAGLLAGQWEFPNAVVTPRWGIRVHVLQRRFVISSDFRTFVARIFTRCSE